MNILWKGARGPSVRTLQARLNDLDLGPVDVDGVYGVTTEQAVVAFQKQHGAFADGVAGPQTLRALGLGEAPAASAQAPAPAAGSPPAPRSPAPMTRSPARDSERNGDFSLRSIKTRNDVRITGIRSGRARSPRRATVFVSYSHEDAKWLEMLQTHIAPLERMGMVNLWDDTDIAPGSRWGEAIREAIASARVAVLLISAHFMASDYIATKELPPILAAAEGEGVLVLPVIISPCWLGDLGAFQAVNPPSEPLVDLRRGDRDRVWLRVVEAITEALNA